MLRLFVRERAIALLAASAFVVAAGCGGGARTPTTPAGAPNSTPTLTPTLTAAPTLTPAPTPTTPTPTVAPTASATATPAPFQGGTRGPVEGEGTAPATTGALLVDVRTGLHVGFDRIVFEFEKGLPGYRIEYVQTPILRDPSGEPVTIAGDAFLKVRFSPAAAHDPFTAERTYLGPLEFTSGLPSLAEAESTGDFEGVLTWVLGLRRAVDFRVFALENPFRVVIDLAHP